MRPRPRTATTAEPRRRATPDRRPHERARSESSPADMTDERRWREAGGPEDQATYSCRCGAVFAADVSTSVACPLCGTAQAW